MIWFPRPGQVKYQLVFHIDDLSGTPVNTGIEYYRRYLNDPSVVDGSVFSATYTQADDTDLNYLKRYLN